MTTARAQVVETSVTEQQQSYSGLRSPGRSTYFKMTPGFKTFPVLMIFVDMAIFTSFSYISFLLTEPCAEYVSKRIVEVIIETFSRSSYTFSQIGKNFP